jgi:hypothetical protein
VTYQHAFKQLGKVLIITHSLRNFRTERSSFLTTIISVP